MLLWLKEKHQILTGSTFFLSVFFQNVAVAPTRLNISMYATLDPPLLPSSLFKNDHDFHQTWSSIFLVLGAHMHCLSKQTIVIISYFGVPDFLCVYLLFIFSIFHTEILTFCCARDVFFGWRLGGKTERSGVPHRESKPGTQHPHRTHRTHDTTDQWRERFWWLGRT